MKILHITDSHGTVKGPESRKDIYYITFLKKLYELGFIVKKMGIDMIIHTGDLFHTARVSDKFAGQVSEMIKAMDIPFYVVPGNHDIEGYTIDTIDQTKLGLLAKAGVITILDRNNPVCITAKQGNEEYTIAISGQEYYAHIDEGNAQDFEMQQDQADLNILAIHGYIADTPQHPDIKCTMANSIISDADIILTGHYHRQFEWSDGQNLDIFNPGSMMRVEQTEYNKTHIPQYGILDITLDSNGYIEWSYDFHSFRIAQPSTIVFDYNAKYKAKATSITLDGFKNSISNTMSSIQPSTTIDKIINDICIGSNIDTKLHQLTLDTYHNTLQNVPDEFEVQQGYIEAQKSKKITKVILENFQSHKHTEIDFDDGLNIIVGESNNGKSSILRAIMWVIDNQPLGADFIMTGEKECEVTICYDDGTKIIRGRTLKDTGYYIIHYYDENGTLRRCEYHGFANAVPVEIANVHQMPKVNITKDIDTHLNVLSQLDGPFLLTESPLVKASAIGRITGTHVVDSAIKDSNKSIQNNRKLIKNYEQELQEKENELKALPDIQIMSEFTNIYANIVAYIKSLNETINKVSTILTNVSQCDTAIDQQQKQYNKYCAFLNMQDIVDIAISKLKDVQSLSSYILNYTNNNKEIVKQEEILNKTKALTFVKPMVYKAYALYSFIADTEYKYNSCNKLWDEIIFINNQAVILKDYVSSLNSIVIHCKILHEYNLHMIPKVSQIADLEIKQGDSVKRIAVVKKNIRNVQKQIKTVQNEKNLFIQDNGICPCCGQKVKEIHVPNIITFMEEKNNANKI